MTLPIPGNMASDVPPLTEEQNTLFIHQLFEEQAEKTPEAVAVICNGLSITYHELNKRANQLAHHLRTLGVGPEILVGLCVDRSVDLIIGLLGILKSGGAYVPIDPDYPPARLAFRVCQVLCVRCSKFTVETFQQMRWRNNLKRLSSQKEAWTISS